jgi:hypothetical protein
MHYDQYRGAPEKVLQIAASANPVIVGCGGFRLNDGPRRMIEAPTVRFAFSIAGEVKKTSRGLR